MDDKIVTLRLKRQEFEALRELAGRELRSTNGWVRFRIVAEAIKTGLMSPAQNFETNNPDVQNDSGEGETMNNESNNRR